METGRRFPRRAGCLRLLYDIAAGQLPARRFRSPSRVVRQKMSNFALKRTEHFHSYQRDACFAQVVALI
jgi:hypothetical protein